jgi:hypothetical protein
VFSDRQVSGFGSALDDELQSYSDALSRHDATVCATHNKAEKETNKQKKQKSDQHPTSSRAGV